MTRTIDRAALRTALLRKRLSGQAGASPEGALTRVSRDGHLPLSSAQRRLWILDRLRPGSAEYLMTTALRLRGQLCRPALQTALDGLVARHEVLRTRYVDVNGEPAQVIDDPTPVTLHRRDGLDALDAVLSTELPTIDLAAGPVFRPTLVCLGEDDHALVLTLHHIAGDAWSEEVMVRELGERYVAASAGREPELAELPVQYVDFAGWQRDRSSGQALAGDLAYWRERLAGLNPLELPTDRPRPPVRDGAGALVQVDVSAPIATRFGRLARDHGVTPFTAFLAAFKVLLTRYTGQTDITVGTPVAGRARPETQDLVGLFLNTLALRTDLSGSPSFRDVLDRVRETVLDGQSHQELPFEQIVDELAPVRDPSRSPLFSTMFLMTDRVTEAHSFGDLAVTALPVGEVAAKFDLTLSVIERANGTLGVGVNYATALFEPETMSRLAGHYAHLLESIVSGPDTPVRRLALLSAAERKQVVTSWNDTAVDQPGATLPGLIADQVRRTPQREAVRFDGSSLTYAELAARSNQLAHHLRSLGVGPESVVGVCLPRSLELVVALLAVQKAGGAYLPLDPDHPAERLRYLREDSGATAMIDTDTFAALAGCPTVDPGVAVRPEHPAYVIYTSGSTGRPKGVVVEHRGIVNRLRWMQHAYGLAATDRVLQKTPASFDVSVWELFWPLITGATLVVARPDGHRDPAYLARLIDSERITTLHFVPSMLRAFLTEPFAGLPSLRRVICSGEALTSDLVAAVHDRIGCELHNLYGPTEASVDVTATRCRPGEPVTIGTPIANTRAYILDQDLQPVPVGVPGELMLAGVQLARGYLHRPALTADRFVPDPFTPGGRLYRTGDLARHRPDGQIDYLGRLDHQVKINGIRVELGEVEHALTENPAVRAAAVTVDDGQLVAHLVSDADLATLPDFLRAQLPEAMIPTHWLTYPALPLTTSGKVDRNALSAPDRSRTTTGGYVAPRTPLEHMIAGAIADALNIDSVGIEDRFFAIGGDSMRAIRVVGALRAAGVELAVHDLFTHQTVAGLAGLAGAASPEDTLVERFAQLSEADRQLLPDGLVDAYPLAETQAGMVYEMLAAPDRTVYLNVSCYRVHDELPFDLNTLRAATEILVGRHEILRTSFDLSTYSETMQLVHATAELPVAHTNLTGLASHAQRAAVDEWLVAERGRPFDIAQPPLLRYHVHEISADEWWLTHTECHAILDGWSHTSVVNELVSIYRRLRTGHQPDLAPPPEVRFADFVAAEKRALATSADHGFWATAIGRYDKLELPDGWASERRDDKATIIDVPWADLAPGLRRLAASAGASMKSVLHAAHLKAISIVTGRRQFFGGLVCNGRPEVLRGDEVFGMYLNTVPFAADVTAATWRDLVADVFAGEAELWPHRRYPMPAMRREWSPGSPLIDVAFGYLDFHVLDWEADTVGMIDDFSPSELPLEVWTFPGLLRLGGRPSRIGRENLELLGRTYRRVLEAMSLDPDASTDVTLAPVDHDHALHLGGDSTRDYPTGELVHQLVEHQATATPDAVAVRQADHTLTYAELDATANRLAHRLRALGAGPGTLVGLFLTRGPDLVVGMLATLRAGAAFLPLDPAYPADRLRYLITDAEVGLLLTEPDLPLPTGVTAAVEIVADHPDLPSARPAVAPSLEDLAYVIYTSGSTGRPKGVGVPHRGALNLRHAQREHLDVRPGDRVLQFASPSFDASVWELLMSLTNGAELVLPPRGTDPGDLRQQAGLVTHMTLPPSLLERLSPEDFPHLRVLVSAGEACPVDQAARWSGRTRFINAYGPTETSVCATLTEVAPTVTAPPSIGSTIGGVSAYVLDPDLRPLAVGVRGELYVGGAGLARGYLGRPGLTAERFVPNPYGPVGARMYRTGDVVSRNHDGTIQYHGRTDHQVKVRGHRIELGEIEAALSGHPAVASAVAAVHRSGTTDAALVAYTRAVDVPPTPAELREYLRACLPGHLLPTHWIAVEDFALTPAGKVDRAVLPGPDGSRPELDSAYVAPSDETERALAAAWREALGVDRVGVHDDFFELGGHSLAMMRVIATLRARDGIELTFRSFITHRTIAALATTVTDEPAGKAMMWLRRSGSATPLFCVHPGGGSAHWYLRLVPHLTPDIPVAAFEWPATHNEVPTAEQMAERYLAELRAAQPRGPYRLFSWCGGSSIATEMARRLTEAGETVTFMLLDPGLDAHTRAEGWQELNYIRRLETLVEQIVADPRADTAERRTEILALLEHLVDDVDPAVGITLPARGVGDVWPRSVRIWREVMELDLAYRHTPYSGQLHLIVSDELERGEHEVAAGQAFDGYVARWRELTEGGVTVHRVPGDHFGVMKPPHVADLGALLGRLTDRR
ncbi:non-ribosomal peptide synthetase [Salinispora sp. H7-4]|uniref:non-ribosomal peptide synthetase n=1 Tax=Salinispora sp. H7-4 TaxID=2748321 RepID=UPI0015D24362|nr:non-ribosomal peptide synthetase [Salinispora sp. H7-4]NYT94925.1 amino acid adenylation domain-containing protein [Salinispora sp. H7-4]